MSDSDAWEKRDPQGSPDKRWALKNREARVVVPRTVVVPELHSLLADAAFVQKNYLEQLKDRGQCLEPKEIQALGSLVKSLKDMYDLNKTMERDNNRDVENLSDVEIAKALAEEAEKADDE